LLPALHAWKTRYSRLRVIEDDGNVGAEFADDWSNYTFRLLEHRGQQMLGLNLLVLIPFRKLDCRLNCFLSS
jgi:hypothetical protein